MGETLPACRKRTPCVREGAPASSRRSHFADGRGRLKRILRAPRVVAAAAAGALPSAARRGGMQNARAEPDATRAISIAPAFARLFG